MEDVKNFWWPLQTKRVRIIWWMQNFASHVNIILLSADLKRNIINHKFISFSAKIWSFRYSVAQMYYRLMKLERFWQNAKAWLHQVTLPLSLIIDDNRVGEGKLRKLCDFPGKALMIWATTLEVTLENNAVVLISKKLVNKVSSWLLFFNFVVIRF